MLTKTLRSVAGRVYWASPHLLGRLAGKVVIFMYHRVLPRDQAEASYVQPGMYVTPPTFDAHLRFVTRHFRVLSFEELLGRWDVGEWDPSVRYAVLTFDDGWLDNYHHAFPLLRQYGVPATIFLPTDLIGSDTWLWPDRLGYLLHRRGRGRPADWDRQIEHAKLLHDADRRRMLSLLEEQVGGAPRVRQFVNWDEVREMSGADVSFGSHTRTHVNLARADGTTLESELTDSLRVVQNQRINAVPALAYPNGDHSDAVVAAARSAGYRAAVTTRPGVESDRPGDLFRLRRIGVHEDVAHSVPVLALHVARELRRGSSVVERPC